MFHFGPEAAVGAAAELAAQRMRLRGVELSPTSNCIAVRYPVARGARSAQNVARSHSPSLRTLLPTTRLLWVMTARPPSARKAPTPSGLFATADVAIRATACARLPHLFNLPFPTHRFMGRTLRRQQMTKARVSTRQARATTGGGRPAITKANYEALADFRFALRKFLAFSEGAAKDAGLTAQQHQALLTIKGAPSQGAVSIQQLSSRLLIQHNTAVELVDRLAEGGLVRRTRDQDDKRRAQLELTPRAERLLASLSAAHLRELQSVRPVLLNLLKQLD